METSTYRSQRLILKSI